MLSVTALQANNDSTYIKLVQTKSSDSIRKFLYGELNIGWISSGDDAFEVSRKTFLNKYRAVSIYFDDTKLSGKKSNEYYLCCIEDFKGDFYYSKLGKYKRGKVIELFKDSSKSFNKFENDYREIYKDFPLINSFFETSLSIYGMRCGYGGSKPKGRLILNSAITNIDIGLVVSLLSSTVSENKAYGLEAYLLLKRDGVVLPEYVNYMVNIISKNRNRINICSGCMTNYEYLSISKLYEQLQEWINEEELHPLLRN